MACTLVPENPYDDTAARRGAMVTVLRGPRRVLLRHKEVGLDLGHLIRQPGEVQIARNHTVLQREDRLH